MSRVVVALPKGMVRHSVIGGAVALGCYVALQFVWALLIHKEVMGEELLYPAVCISAAAASFLGCMYSLLSSGAARMLPVSAVVAVFLSVTMTAALLTAETVAVSNGLTGVGLSMAAGGLLAALLGGSGRRGRSRRRRRT